MSDSVRSDRRQPTRLRRPWDSPGKNSGVGCHFLLQCMKVKSESEVTQSCLTLSNPMDCSLPGSSLHSFPGKSTGAGCRCLLRQSSDKVGWTRHLEICSSTCFAFHFCSASIILILSTYFLPDIFKFLISWQCLVLLLANVKVLFFIFM